MFTINTLRSNPKRVINYCTERINELTAKRYLDRFEMDELSRYITIKSQLEIINSRSGLLSEILKEAKQTLVKSNRQPTP